MRHGRKGTTASILGLVLMVAAGVLRGAPSTGEWSGTVASVSGDDLALVGVADRFRVAGGVTESLSGRSVLPQDLAPGSSVTLRIGEREADGRFRADRVVLQPKSPLALSGEIDRIADDRRHLEVHGVQVEIDAHTAFAGRVGSGVARSIRDLRPGMTVRAALVPTVSGTLRAAEVRLTGASTEPGEDQEFKGTVVAISDTAWTIDDKTFTITDQTLFEGDPGVGDFVEVKFHLDADGNAVADRIQKEDADPGAEVEFMGIVEAIGESSWTISGTVVTVDASTEIIGGPKVGDNVEVHAVKAADGSLLARRIQLEDAQENEVEFNGTVESIGDSSWQIAGKTVLVDASTEILGNPAVGDQVEVKALQAPDGTLKAVRIRKEDSNGDGNGDPSDGNGNDNGTGDTGGDNSGDQSGNHHGNDDGMDD